MLPKLKMGTSSSDSETVTDVRLPQNLITEILLYLPVKSLGQFKCVSKPWRSLISNPKFIKSHFSKSLKDDQRFNHQLLFVDHAAVNSGMKHCSLYAALQLHNPSTNVVVSDVEYPSLDQLQGRVWIVGIVNGLVCLFVGAKDLYIWNPILKQSKLLPGSGSSLPVSSLDIHGFGYDESNDDYKVVELFNDRFSQSEFKVYSLRRDSWRTIVRSVEGYPSGSGTYANGKIFWATTLRAMGIGDYWRIDSLDMASDTCEEVQSPGYEDRIYNCGIGSFGGSLSLLFCKYCRADLWVRDENGVENSWSKLFAVSYDVCVGDPHRVWYSLRKVVCVLGDGEIVMEDNSQLVVYCTKKKEFRSIQLNANGGGVYHGYCAYVESLVPV